MGPIGWVRVEERWLRCDELRYRERLGVATNGYALSRLQRCVGLRGEPRINAVLCSDLRRTFLANKLFLGGLGFGETKERIDRFKDELGFWLRSKSLQAAGLVPEILGD